MDVRNMLLRADKERLDKGLSKAEFYKRCGVSAAAVSLWRTGKTSPAKTTIDQMAKVLDVRSEWLLTGNGPKTAHDPLDALQLLAVDTAAEGKKKSLDEENLTEGERAILELFRQLPAEKQRLVNTMLELALSKHE